MDLFESGLWKIILGFLCSIAVKGQLGTGPCQSPPNFPPNIKFTIQSYHSFSREIKIPFAYVVTPRNTDQVLSIVNWAFVEGYRVRGIGFRQSFSPLTFALSDNEVICPKVILLDTTRHFASIKLDPPDLRRPELRSVTVGPGVKLRHLLDFLESHDLGLFSCPSTGSVSVGGMLAIGAHGSGAESEHDRKSLGHTYGTVSNLVVQMTIVSWDPDTFSYVLKTIHRSAPEAKAFLVHLGRTFITSVTLRVGADQNLRSQSHFFIPMKEIFGHPHALDSNPRSRSLSKFVESYGRVNVVGMSTGQETQAWVITWKVEPIKPPKSRLALTPYNYYFMNYFPPTLLDPLLRRMVKYVPTLWNVISLFSYPVIRSGTKLSRSEDYWGPSKNHLLYFTNMMPRQRPNPFVVVTSKKNLQLVAHILRSHYDTVAKEFQAGFSYPTAGEFNVRVTGVDDPSDVEIPGAESPSFSNARPIPEHPDYDRVIWFEFSAYGETARVQEFATRLQNLYYRDIHGQIGILRVEWSKGWAHTDFGPWTNTSVIEHFSRVFSSSDKLEEWNWAVKELLTHDPHRTFSNDFLDELLVVRR